MSNTSATGGYLLPTSSEGQPGGLTLEQFIQSVLVGISGYAGTLVREKWQENPPKQPDISVDWIAFGIVREKKDTYAYVDSNVDGSSTLKRQERLEIQLSFYGPNARSNMSALSDGFQIQQNLEAMRAARMGYQDMTEGIPGPDLVNGRWVKRWEASLFLNREIVRVYPVLDFVQASGTIHTIINQSEVTIDWETNMEDT